MHNEGLLRDFALSPKGSSLRSKLLLLADSPDDSVSLPAKKLNGFLEGTLAGNVGGQAAKSTIDLINDGLGNVGAESLSYVTLQKNSSFETLIVEQG